MDQSFLDELNEIGTPVRKEAATPGQIAFGLQHVSETYAQFIGQHGYGTIHSGRFQFCPIERFRPLAALIFKADADFSHNDCHIVGFDAFGTELHAWSEKHFFVKIDLLEYKVECIEIAPSLLNFTLPASEVAPPPKTADSMTRMILPTDHETGEMWDYKGDPMYTRCVKAYGALEFGEVYGFFPSLGLVGYNSTFRSVENIKRVKALEHFSMIAQMQDFNLVRYNMGRDEVVRQIG